MRIKLSVSLERGERRHESRNRSGQAYALSVITPILPNQKEALVEYLEALPGSDASPFIRMGRTHFVRIVIIDHLIREVPSQKQDILQSDYLFFESTFDGDLDPYLEALRSECAVEADAIWGACVGYPSSSDSQRFRDYLRHNQVDTSMFVAGYPDATVTSVLEALALQRSLVDFAISAQDLHGEALQRAYFEAFGGQPAALSHSS